ncbi:MAG: mitochondrial fission ELM1 family protein [Geminicoccaceae bacterium]|nr:mitochondrial fission ELM1 family protein [Geminicoccaceae bacterium]
MARSLGHPFAVMKPDYRATARLPNLLTGRWLDTTRQGWVSPAPDLVIGCGRRTAPVALAIAHRFTATRLVQIMWPEVMPGRFDLVVLPEHDRRRRAASILRVLLPPTDLMPPVAPRVVPGSLLAVIGGTRRGRAADVAGFVERVRRAAGGGQVEFIASPRTPAGLATLPDLQPFDTYAERLARCERVAVTGESASVMADAARFGRPLLIDRLGQASHGKLAILHDLLRENRLACDLARPVHLPTGTLVDTASEIAHEIRRRGLLTT